MLTIAIVSLALAAVLLAYALRGRVVARGRFCRKCRFDLEGHGADAVMCPECGRDLAGPKPTRSTLRRIRRLPLAAAVILQIAGIGLLLVQAPGIGARIVAGLPDAAVVRLAGHRLDAAVDELAARATRTPPMADPVTARAVELALAHQADASEPWDPRWGEVLAEAFVGDRMTNDQIARYLTHGFEREIQIRDRVNRPDADIGYRVLTRTVRMQRLPTSQPVYARDLMIRTETVSVGATAPGAPNRGPGGSMGMQLYIPNQSIVSSGWTGSAVPVRAEDWSAEEPGDELTVRAEYRVVLKNHATGREVEITTLEAEQRVRLLAPDEPVVTTIADPAAAERAAYGIGVEPFAILPVLPNTLPAHGATIAHIGFRFGDLPHALAGWLYVVDPRDRSEIRVARVVQRPPGSMVKYGWLARAGGWGGDLADPERMLGVAEAVLDAGVATLVFRTDPTTAESEADIDAVLDLTAVFEDVPVHRAQTEADLNRGVGVATDTVRGRSVGGD